MAVTYGASGAVAYTASGGQSVSPAYPTGITAGQLLVVTLGYKPSVYDLNGVDPLSGWTLVRQFYTQGGYGTSAGADTGGTLGYIYCKVATGSETGTLSISISGAQTGSMAWAQIHRFTGTDGDTWSYTVAFGQRTTTPTSPLSITTENWTVTDWATGDALLGMFVIPTDVTTPSQFSAHSVTGSGLTFAAVTEISEPDSSTGNDIGGVVFRSAVTAGAATVDLTWSATLAGTLTNVRGPLGLMRIRYSSPTVNASGSSAGAATASAEGAATRAGAGASTASATAASAGAATAASSGTSTAAASATAAGSSVITTVGAAAGTATAAAEGQAVYSAAGSSAGAATASAAGRSTAAGAGASSGAATAAGGSASTAAAAASAAAVATADGAGGSIVAITGNAAGSALAIANAADGPTTITGSVSASSTAAAVSNTILSRAGAVSALATAAAAGASTAAASGAGAGAATAAGAGVLLRATVGASTAQATAAGVGRSTAAASGASAGVATPTAQGVGATTAVGNAAAAATVSGVGTGYVPAAGAAAGAATAAAVGTGINLAAGAASATATVSGQGSVLQAAAGSSAGTSTADGAGFTLTLIAAVGTAQVPTIYARNFTARQTIGSDTGGLGCSVSISADGVWLIAGQLGVDGAWPDEGAVAIFKRVDGAWVQTQQILALGSQSSNYFGKAVAISADGSTFITADKGGSSRGAVRVFVRTDDTWALQDSLLASDQLVSDLLGSTLDISGDGNRVIAGNIRGAYVFVRSGTTWTQEQKLVTTSTYYPLVNISRDGTTALVADQTATVSSLPNAGVVHIFTRTGTTWSLQQTIENPYPVDGARFGRAAAMSADGNTVVAAPRPFWGPENGMTSVFTRQGSTWTQQATIVAPYDEFMTDAYGYPLALSPTGTRLAIGYNDALRRSLVRVYDLVFGVWNHRADLFARASTGYFPTAITFSDPDTNFMVVGAQEVIDSGFTTVGALFAYEPVDGVSVLGAHGAAIGQAAGTATTIAYVGGFGFITGSAAGAATASATSRVTIARAATSAGAATVAATGRSTATAAGAAAGAATAAATAAEFTLTASTGAAAGAATAAAVSLPPSVGAAAGTSTASAASVLLRAAAGAAAGVATASADTAGTFTTAGAADGAATATGAGAARVARAGAAAGTATAAAAGASLFRASGAAAGAATASADPVAFRPAASASGGTATASAVGRATFAGTGTAEGVASAAAEARSTAAGQGTAAGVATAFTEGTGGSAGAGFAAGTAGGVAIARAFNLTMGNEQATLRVPLNLRYMLVPVDPVMRVPADDHVMMVPPEPTAALFTEVREV